MKQFQDLSENRLKLVSILAKLSDPAFLHVFLLIRRARDGRWTVLVAIVLCYLYGG